MSKKDHLKKKVVRLDQSQNQISQFKTLLMWHTIKNIKGIQSIKSTKNHKTKDKSKRGNRMMPRD